jgi:hypothetical protein
VLHKNQSWISEPVSYREHDTPADSRGVQFGDRLVRGDRLHIAEQSGSGLHRPVLVMVRERRAVGIGGFASCVAAGTQQATTTNVQHA